MGASISVICFQLERDFTIEWEWIQLWLVDGDMKLECGLHVEGDMKLDGCLHMTMEKLLISLFCNNNKIGGRDAWAYYLSLPARVCLHFGHRG